jgi:hypothetical protein
MGIGLQPTKEQIDSTAGDIARGVFYQLRRAQALKEYLDTKTVEQLVAMGYVEANGVGEVTGLKAAVAMLDALRQVFEGVRGWPDDTARDDFRPYVRPIAGMGDV